MLCPKGPGKGSEEVYAQVPLASEWQSWDLNTLARLHLWHGW